MTDCDYGSALFVALNAVVQFYQVIRGEQTICCVLDKGEGYNGLYVYFYGILYSSAFGNHRKANNCGRGFALDYCVYKNVHAYLFSL